WTDPSLVNRRVDIGSVRCRTGNAREAPGTVVRHRHRSGLPAELHESRVAKGKSRAIEGIEVLEEKDGHRLTEIDGRLADRAEQIAGVEFGNAGSHSREIVGGNDHRWLCQGAQTREVEPVIDVRGIRSSDEQGMRGSGRPAGKVGGAEIGCVKLCS